MREMATMPEAPKPLAKKWALRKIRKIPALTTTMAQTQLSMSSQWWASWYWAMSSEMLPGPANIGMARGVNANPLRVWASCATSLFIPRSLLNLPFNKAKPELAIISPPAMRKAEMDIPKN